MAILLSASPPKGTSSAAGAHAVTCGEASCVPAQSAYISHFSGPDCTGTNSYYLPAGRGKKQPARTLAFSGILLVGLVVWHFLFWLTD
jgi:hypothetical protein